MVARWASAFVLAFLVLFTVASTALAQPESGDARARTFFVEGVDLAERGDWAAASQKFEAALALRDSPAVRYNLAQSLEHLGRLVEASDHLNHLEAGGRASAGIRRDASELRSHIEPRIGRIVVTVRGDSSAATIRVRSRELPRESYGASVPTDPGPARVVLEVNGSLVDETEVAIPEGGVAHVVLAVPVAGEAPEQTEPQVTVTAPTPSEVAVSQAASEDDGPRRERPADEPSIVESPWFWGAIGGAVVIGVVLTVVLASSSPDPTQGDFDMPVLELE